MAAQEIVVYRSQAEKHVDEIREGLINGVAEWFGAHWETIVFCIQAYLLVALVYLVVSVAVEVYRKRFDGIGGNIGEALVWPVSLFCRMRLGKVVSFLMHGKG